MTIRSVATSRAASVGIGLAPRAMSMRSATWVGSVTITVVKRRRNAGIQHRHAGVSFVTRVECLLHQSLQRAHFLIEAALQRAHLIL